jgi:hypothetical protein
MRPTSPFVRESMGFMGPLVFSLTGLLLNGAVLLDGGNQLSPAWRFAFVAGAPALAAIAALKVTGDDRRDLGSRNRFGRR